ncbi:MAG: AMP-binding protein [Clostridia bacterium]|nr:AMP-binding protein [Clostridia bacterium]
MEEKVLNETEEVKKNTKPVEVKIHRKPKTDRKYERVSDAVDFCRVIAKHGDRVAFSYFGEKREVIDMTYGEFASLVKNVAAGLTELGYAGKKIAVIGETSVFWHAAYLATLATGGVAIPMDKELEVEVINGLLGSVDADAIVYSGSFNGKFVPLMNGDTTLSMFVAVAPDEKELENSKVKAYSDVVSLGKAAVENGYEYPPVENRDKLAEMLFTSGTTGTSKCVMLSQKNVFSVVTSAAATVDFKPDDTIVSVLPVHHTYELACTLAGLVYGMHICINDSIARVLKNFQIFKPTGLVLVPLFVYTMYKKIWNEAKKSGRDKALKLGLGASKAMMKVGIDKRRSIFADVHNSFGGRLEKIICGGAALNPRMIEFFEDIGISIYEGFGITECAPLTFVTPYFARKYGSVGPAVPCCQGRIAGDEINDKGYIEGEIQIKGDNVMLGYFNNPEANEVAFTEDGWFRTGDMGYMDSDGYFYITGRLKTVIILENGKNVYPEEIEEHLGSIEKIAECVVVGRQEGTAVNLVVIVYPDRTKFPEGATEAEILADIESEIATVNKTLPTYKQAKIVELRDTEFEKTTSKKIKRHLVK